MIQLFWKHCRAWSVALLFVAAADTAATAQSAASATGTISGTVTYQADPDRPWRLGRYYISNRSSGQLAEAVVALRAEGLAQATADPEARTVEIDQKNFRFDPETVAIHAGDQIKFLNSDREIHNVKSADGKPPFNVNLPAGGQVVQPIELIGGIENPVRLACSFHSAMRGWIFVFDQPFFQVTSKDGQFRWEGVPPGSYQLDMRHPAGNLKWSQEIKIEAGEALTLDIQVSPDNKESAAP